MTRVALVCYLPTHFVELRRLALAMLREPARGFEPVVSFAQNYPGRAQNAEFCRASSIPFRFDLTEADPPVPGSGEVMDLAHAARASLPQRMAKRLPYPVRILVRSALAYRRARVRAERQRTAAVSLLDGTKAEIVVIAEDNLDYGTPWLVKEAHRRGAKVMVLPYTVATELEFAEAFFEDELRRVNGFNRWFAKRFPKWVYEHRGRALLRSPPPTALLLESAGVAPPRPWILNSGYADAIAAESEAMVENYLRCGLPPSQVVLTGSLSDDALASRLASAATERRELESALGLSPRRWLVVTGLSPNQIADRPKGLLEFSDYESLVRAWISGLTSLPDTNVVVSLHPSIPASSLPYLEGLGAKIATGRDIASLIPLADFYVAGASATIRLAVSCGKPVLNYDAYRYRYSDYTAIPGVVTVETRADFDATARRLATDDAYYSTMAERQRQYARRWGLLDGGSTDRVFGLLSRLAPSG